MAYKTQVSDPEGFITVASKRSKRKQPEHASPVPQPQDNPANNPLFRVSQGDFQRILQAAEGIIKELNLSTLAGFLQPMQVVCTLHKGTPRARLFLGDIFGQEVRLELAARVPLYFRTSEDGTRHLMVMSEGGGPRSFLEWVEQLRGEHGVPVDSILIDPRGYELQLAWWQARGQSFNFSALPDELQ
jgi:hypothetical protein